MPPRGIWQREKEDLPEVSAPERKEVQWVEVGIESLWAWGNPGPAALLASPGQAQFGLMSELLPV